MKKRSEKFYCGRYMTVIIMLSLVFISGCLGTVFSTGSRDHSSMVIEGFEGNPDNCTKCHYAWAKRFDYHRGWDRYGYIFSGDGVVGNYDPWSTPSLNNMFQAYYATDWWDTPELYSWPADISEKIESLCMITRDRKIPEIPHSIQDIEGPVLIVSQKGGEYTSIQKAIDEAASGATVYVQPGVYHEVLVLKTA